MHVPDLRSRVHTTTRDKVARRVKVDRPDCILVIGERVRLALLLKIPEANSRVTAARRAHVSTGMEVARADPIAVSRAAHKQLGWCITWACGYSVRIFTLLERGV